LISSPTAISMMTGVFHFMAISLSRNFVYRKLRLGPNPVNARSVRSYDLFRGGLASLLLAFAVFALGLGRGVSAETLPSPRFSILVFSKTTGYRHDSIPDGIAAIRALGAEHGFAMDDTEDAGRFTDAGLAPYRAVVFLSTTGDILDAAQKAAFERYIRSGGGFAGVHSASDTEYGWAWYGRLVGAYFKSHPAIQPATIRIADPEHASTSGLPQQWQRTDEWYNFRSNPRGAVHVLATLDEATYSGGTMGTDHPIAWCQTVGKGRSWYTAMGHTAASYAEPLFRRHLLGGIESAAGVAGDCPARAQN
jgi:cytochrome c